MRLGKYEKIFSVKGCSDVDKCLRFPLERQEQNGQQKKEKYGNPAGIKRPKAGNLQVFCASAFSRNISCDRTKYA